jgi:PAS domain S-box-containing protein
LKSRYGFRLISLVVAATLPIALGASLFVWYVARQERATVDRLRVEVAARVASLVDRELEADIGVLSALAISTELDEGDIAAFREELRRVLATRPAWFNIIVLDRNGWQILNMAAPPGAPAISAVEPTTFAEVLRTGSPVVAGVVAPGPFIRRPGVPVRVPVLHDGEVSHVLTALLAPESFLEVLRAAELPAGWIAVVVDRQGLIVARSRDHERHIGGTASKSVLESRASGARSAAYDGRTLDGVAVMGAYATSSVSGWTVHVGLPAETVNGQGRRAIEAVVAGSVVSVALAALLIWAVHRELSERRVRVAELALADSGARLQAVVETAADGIVTIDEAGRIETVNSAVGRMFGYAPEELIGRNLSVLMPEPHRSAHDGYLEHFARTGERRIIGTSGREVEGLRKDGEVFPLELAVAESRLHGRRLYTRMLRDITVRKRAEERQRLLIDELNHRVENTLTLIQGMARQTVGAVSVAAFVETFGGRLRALAAAHDLLVSGGWGGTALGELIRCSLAPHGFPGRIAVEVEQDVLLLPALAQDLALTLHELGTNAIKHGALSVPAGRVLVRAQVEPDREGAELRLLWAEQGGPPVQRPQRSGFGTTLVTRILVHGRGGSVALDWRPQGLECRIVVPLAPSPAEGVKAA